VGASSSVCQGCLRTGRETLRREDKVLGIPGGGEPGEEAFERVERELLGGVSQRVEAHSCS
jgi:hypothetical protein